jgi:hypothetical protein
MKEGQMTDWKKIVVVLTLAGAVFGLGYLAGTRQTLSPNPAWARQDYETRRFYSRTADALEKMASNLRTIAQRCRR